MTVARATQPMRRGARWLLVTAVIVVSAASAVSAFAQHGPHHGGGFGGPGMFAGSPEHIDRAVDRMLSRLNATDTQRTQIKQIVQAAATDLKSQRDAARTLHEQGLAVFTAPTVDPAQAESIRQQMLTQHDTASRRVLQAMLDISRVLTPEQRAQIGSRIKQREERMKERFQRRQSTTTP
jgi:Spy/CpxP family protein refolding chaperone